MGWRSFNANNFVILFLYRSCAQSVMNLLNTPISVGWCILVRMCYRRFWGWVCRWNQDGDSGKSANIFTKVNVKINSDTGFFQALCGFRASQRPGACFGIGFDQNTTVTSRRDVRELCPLAAACFGGADLPSAGLGCGSAHRLRLAV